MKEWISSEVKKEGEEIGWSWSDGKVMFTVKAIVKS